MVGAFFIDKDGTLVDNSSYPIIPKDDLLENDVLDGLKIIQSKGYKIFIISNQPWISKNMASVREIDDVFERLISKLANQDIFVSDYIYCPHTTSDGCACKKPSPKMILDMSKKHEIDLNHSFMVGDMGKDILAGKNAGVKTILVLTGNGKNFVDCGADHIVENINKIGDLI